MPTRLRTLPSMMLVLVLAAGCQSVTGQTAGELIDDATITSSIKTKLTAERPRNIAAIGVDTENGVVVLTGQVETLAQKQRAEQIAQSISGVKRVVNLLQIQGAAAASPPPATTPR